MMSRNSLFKGTCRVGERQKERELSGREQKGSAAVNPQVDSAATLGHTGRTAMDPQVYKAAKHGDIKLLRRVVNEDPSRLLRLSPQGNTAVHVSVRFGHIELVKEVYAALLQHNSRLAGATEYTRSLSLLTEVNSVGDTALQVAAREGHASIAEFLIDKILPWRFDHGHDVESGQNSLSVVSGRNREREVGREKIRMRNKSNNTAMHEAVRMNDLKMVKSLTKVDPDSWRPIFDADAEGGESLLYLAARYGSSDILNQIFLIFPSPTHGGPHGRTALHVAVLEGHLDVVKVLLEKQGEILVTKVDENGRTALHYAASRSCNRIVQQLLSHDTSISSPYKLDKDGLSPLHIAALESTNISIFRELIQWCPDSVELQDKKRRNVLHHAVMSRDYLKKIRFALKQPELQELVNQPDEDGNTPFHLAARRGSFEAMNRFHSTRRLDSRATNNNGQTAADIFYHHYSGRHGTLTTLFPRIMLDRFRFLRYARRGEEKWSIGGANEEQIHCEPNKQAEIVEASPTARPEVTKHDKDMGKALLIVTSFIAASTFIAVFQVPGGYNSNDGTPILKDNKSFQNFFTLVIQAMTFSMFSLFTVFVGSVLGKSAYYEALRTAKLATMMALGLTGIAFFEGLTAVLPPCESFRWHSFFIGDYNCMTAVADTHRYFTAYMHLVLFIALSGSMIVNSRYAKFKGSQSKYE